MLQNVTNPPKGADPTVRTSPFIELLIAIHLQSVFQRNSYSRERVSNLMVY
jgi:hypothetical protein